MRKPSVKAKCSPNNKPIARLSKKCLKRNNWLLLLSFRAKRASIRKSQSKMRKNTSFNRLSKCQLMKKPRASRSFKRRGKKCRIAKSVLGMSRPNKRRTCASPCLI